MKTTMMAASVKQEGLDVTWIILLLGCFGERSSRSSVMDGADSGRIKKTQKT